MLAGIEDVDDIHILFRYLVNDLVPPLGYRSIVSWLISQVFLSGVFFREVAHASAQLHQGLFCIPGCTYRVFSNMVVDTIKSLLSLW